MKNMNTFAISVCAILIVFIAVQAIWTIDLAVGAFNFSFEQCKVGLIFEPYVTNGFYEGNIIQEYHLALYRLFGAVMLGTTLLLYVAFKKEDVIK